MAQFGRPDGDVTNTGTGGFASIDEATASDSDFWWGADNTAAELEVSLGALTDPVSSSGHVVRYRIAKTNDGVLDGAGNSVTVTMRLMQGATEIAADTAKTATGTWTTYTFNLSGAQADAITDYSDLRIEFVTSASGGNPTNRRGAAVSWAELEVPDAATPVSGSADQVLPTLSQDAAGFHGEQVDFPTTDVLDGFNRADENPLSDGGAWNGPTRDNFELLRVVSNQAAHHDGTGAQGAMYRDDQVHARPLEVFITCTVRSTGDFGIDYCIQNPGGPGTLDGYRWQTNGAVLQLYRITNGTFLKISGDYAINAVDGDSLGVRLRADGVHELYYQTGGVWSLVDDTIDDDTYTDGFVGFLLSPIAAMRAEDFGGGGLLVSGAADSMLPALAADAEGAASLDGAADATLPTLAGDAAASVAVAGTAAGTLGSLSQAAAGAAAVEATADAALPTLTADAAGTVASNAVSGAADQTLPAMGQDAAGFAAVEAEAASVLPGLTQSTAGAAAVEGQGGQTLPELTQDAAGSVGNAIAGAADSTLPTLGSDAAGGLGIDGSAAGTLGGLSSDAAGTITITGTTGGTLGALAAAAGGTLTVAGDGASALPALDADATGTALFPGGPVSGTLAVALPAFGQDADGLALEPGLPTIRASMLRLLRLPALVGAQLGRNRASDQWRKLRDREDVVLTREQLSMFSHPAMPDLETSELWLLSGGSTLTPTE